MPRSSGDTYTDDEKKNEHADKPIEGALLSVVLFDDRLPNKRRCHGHLDRGSLYGCWLATGSSAPRASSGFVGNLGSTFNTSTVCDLASIAGQAAGEIDERLTTVTAAAGFPFPCRQPASRDGPRVDPVETRLVTALAGCVACAWTAAPDLRRVSRA